MRELWDLLSITGVYRSFVTGGSGKFALALPANLHIGALQQYQL